ncbi:MAG: hypothetical protein NT053_16870 [Cyanobacteria bacterium]|nr:hypothetical protein [Cyanobacteriota bacterium]
MNEDYGLGVQLRQRIAQSLAQGLEADQRRVDALVGDLISNNQHILTSAVKYIAKAPAAINCINSENRQSAELALTQLLKEIEIIYSPTVCTRTAEVARGMLGLSPSNGELPYSRHVSTKIHIDPPKPVLTDVALADAGNNKALLQYQRQSLIMFMGGNIAGLLIMAGVGAMIGIASLRNQPSRISTPPITKPKTFPPTAEQKKTSSSEDEAPKPRRSSFTETKQTQKGNEIDDIADEIFWRKYPQMYGKKLSSRDGALPLEWARIRRCDAVVDHAFYQLYPSMRGQTIDLSNSDMVTIWNQIRASVAGCQ